MSTVCLIRTISRLKKSIEPLEMLCWRTASWCSDLFWHGSGRHGRVQCLASGSQTCFTCPLHKLFICQRLSSNKKRFKLIVVLNLLLSNSQQTVQYTAGVTPPKQTLVYRTTEMFVSFWPINLYLVQFSHERFAWHSALSRRWKGSGVSHSRFHRQLRIN